MPLALLLLGERDVEVEVEVAAERGRPGKRPAHPLLVGLQLGERRARHRRKRDVVILQVDDDAVEPVRDRRAGRTPGRVVGPEHEVVDEELRAPSEEVRQRGAPSSVSKRYALSIRTHGSSCRRRATSSLRRVSSFSALSRSSGPSASRRETTFWRVTSCSLLLLVVANICPFRPASAGRIPSAGGSSRPRTAPAPCRWRGRPACRGACASRR